jgi:3-oxoacyl-[acyl-carrier-protein] synthase III
MITPRLCAPAYELGEYAEPVTELQELLAMPQVAADLTSPAGGFLTYRWSEAPVTELMTAAVRRCLAESGLPGAEIDLVLVASDSLPPGRAAHRDVAEFLAETGMKRATVTTIGLMDCATAIAGLGVAASFVRDGTARHVMLVSGDLAELSTGGQRVVAGGAAIASDAATAALVSADAAGLPLLAMAHHTATAQVENGGTPRSRLAARSVAYQELFARLGARHPVRPDDALVLPSNFARDVMRMYLTGAGFDSEHIAQENVSRIAHCQGSDPLINLADRLSQWKAAEPGGQGVPGAVVLLGAGISHLAAVLLGSRTLPALRSA